MLISQVQLAGVGGFDDLSLFLDDPSGSTRRLVVLFGGEGTGKTSILAAIAATRPGRSLSQGSSNGFDEDGPFVAVAYSLGDDDPERPHVHTVVSRNARVPGEGDEAVLRRLREQAIFDRRASEGGFVLVAFSGARWFSRVPMMLTTPERTVLCHDTKREVVFDDPTRADLGQETKQVLAYSAVGSAVARVFPDASLARLDAFDTALREVLEVLLEDTGAAYLGPSPIRLEPSFGFGGRVVELDGLPRSLRHRVALGALTVRALAAAYPTRDPRDAEGVALVDDLEVEQDLRSQRALPGLLRRALPRVQWIVTTASPHVTMGCDVNEVVALRRMPGARAVQLYEGRAAVMH